MQLATWTVSTILTVVSCILPPSARRSAIIRWRDSTALQPRFHHRPLVLGKTDKRSSDFDRDVGGSKREMSPVSNCKRLYTAIGGGCNAYSTLANRVMHKRRYRETTFPAKRLLEVDQISSVSIPGALRVDRVVRAGVATSRCTTRAIGKRETEG
ncbi:hypothetical protein B0H14DRAFT_3134860 [Mycena olivaceomarginata]|nr:hypothetical protein B0H14DRAFT_3134860 [Mycena olivaceomarginata]